MSTSGEVVSKFIKKTKLKPAQCFEIDANLLAYKMHHSVLKKTYLSAKDIIDNPKKALDQSMAILIEHEIYLEGLAIFEFPKDMLRIQTNVNVLIDEVKQLKAFFECQYNELDCNDLPITLIKKRKDILNSTIDFKRCCDNLFDAEVVFAEEYLAKNFSIRELWTIATAHSNSYLNLLIGIEFLKRAKDNILCIKFAIELLHIKDSHALEVHHGVLKEKIKEFVREYGEIRVKKDLIKLLIERKLASSTDSSPWELGWAGSKFQISYNGINYDVPEGISKLYGLVTDPQEENFEDIKELTSKKAITPSLSYSFFSTITGIARSDSTQDTYKEFNTITGMIF